MVNRIRKNFSADSGNHQDSQTHSKLLSSTTTPTTDKQDELIVSLAERYENRRARQVGEWEQLYGQNVYRAF